MCLTVPIPMQEKEMEKQKMLYQQARLHDRGAAEMVLQMISASKGGERLTSVSSNLPSRCPDCVILSLPGRLGAMVTVTLKLGISILNGGNILVQQVHLRACCLCGSHSFRLFLTAFALLQKMLDYLKEKRDVGFFKSLSGLMMSCR